MPKHSIYLVRNNNNKNRQTDILEGGRGPCACSPHARAPCLPTTQTKNPLRSRISTRFTH